MSLLSAPEALDLELALCPPEQWERGWKVVRTNFCPVRECLWFFSATRLGRYLIYNLDEITRPQPGDGPLFVFDSRGDALVFRDSRDSDIYQVFPCLYLPSQETEGWVLLNQRRLTLPLDCAPGGSVLAQAVILERDQTL